MPIKLRLWARHRWWKFKRGRRLLQTGFAILPFRSRVEAVLWKGPGEPRRLQIDWPASPKIVFPILGSRTAMAQLITSLAATVFGSETAQMIGLGPHFGQEVYVLQYVTWQEGKPVAVYLHQADRQAIAAAAPKDARGEPR